MDTIQAIRSRTSTRSYRDEQIGEDALQAILEAGMSAPVGSGAYDSLHLTIVQNRELFPKIDKAVSDLIFSMSGKRMDKNFGAPTMVFVSSRPAAVPGLEYANAACVLENMAIAATGLGIDSIIWGGAAAVVAQSEELTAKLEIPEGYKPVLCISLGYGKNETQPNPHEISVNRVVES